MATSSAHSSSRTILVVEDDTEIREVIRDVLDAEGYRVLTAEHGADALAVLTVGPRPCVILLDLMMPVMNGWELFGILRADVRYSDIPITIVSAVADRSKLPGARFIKKPVNLETLIQAVAEACG